MEEALIDLETLGLSGGQAVTLERDFRPADPIVGGEPFPIEGADVHARLDVSRTTAGWALRLRAKVNIGGACARCLEPARPTVTVDAREIEQGGEDSELTSPYVEDGLLDAAAWLHDAITLALPDKVLCRPDCAGLCPECGINLNDPAAAGHHHDAPLDPRFAKLRELQGD